LVLLSQVVRRELREFIVGAGMAALAVLLEEERRSVCGPRYLHQADRAAHRVGHVDGELVLGGRRVRVRRPRALTMAGREVTLPSWSQFSDEDPLRGRAVDAGGGLDTGVAPRNRTIFAAAGHQHDNLALYSRPSSSGGNFEAHQLGADRRATLRGARWLALVRRYPVAKVG
jgi:hypothetical protein